MSIKSKLRKWLEIPEQRDYTQELEEATQRTLDKLDHSFTQRIARFRVINCINCGKGVIEERDKVYTNFKGQKFCSHECIDAFKEAPHDDK